MYSSAPALAVLVVVLPIVRPAAAQDWTNAGGNAQRNGQYDGWGPIAADFLWSSGPSTIIGWQPVTAGKRVFAVRQLGFPPGAEPGASPVVAYDLDTGTELWSVDVPFDAGDWTTWVAGTSNGQVYVARSGNGDTSEAPLYALDQTTGAVVWTSQDEIRASGYDGVVFAPDGDPIVAWGTSVVRIDADSGGTVWQSSRQCSVTSSCGGALFGDALYLVDVAPGGHVVKRFDLATGAFQYQGSLMPGFLVQSTPMVAPDGAIVFSRTQNNPITDFLYVFDDSGTALTERWNVPTGWTTTSEFAIGFDGSIYAMASSYQISRHDPATGAVLDLSPALPTNGYATRMATDRDGRVFAVSGSDPVSELYCFEPDLSLRWSVPAPSLNVGAPVLGADGTLVVAGKDAVTAYRSPAAFTDLGFALATSTGSIPVLAGQGTLTPGNVVELAVFQGTPSSPTFLVVGSSTVFTPVAGGTLVPSPDSVLFLGSTNSNGALALAPTWPSAAAAGTPVVLQAWSIDLANPGFFSATNGLSGTGAP